MKDKEIKKELIREIEKISNLFIEKENKICKMTKFDEIIPSIYLEGVRNREYKRAGELIIAISQEYVEIIISIYFIDWWRNFGLSEDFSSYGTDFDYPIIFWNDLVKMIIVYFHTKMRSILDYISRFLFELVKLSINADRIAQILKPKRFKRFSSLFNWFTGAEGAKMIKNKQAKLVGQDIINLVKNGVWYKTIRTVRDSLLHPKISKPFDSIQTTRTVTFSGNQDGIYFEIITGFETLKDKLPIFLRGTGNLRKTIKFELYAAYFLVKLYSFLEELAEISQDRLNLSFLGNTLPQEGQIFSIILNWIKKLLHRLESN
ncbi:MAG: hypothetical protein ACFFD2_00605 [Promethearchaeota archaeon]